jgi:glycosyltransferase involved in cell wall biosynthesis
MDDHPRVGTSRSGLRIGLVAPPWLPVPPPDYGGTELVVDLLARGLTAAGCEVVLFSTGDATCPVETRWLFRRSLGTAPDRDAEVAQVTAAYAQLGDVDLIHDHTVEGPSAWAHHPPAVPVVTTMHGMVTPTLRQRYAAAAGRGVAVVAISAEQRRRARPVPVAATIHHGVDPARFPVGRGDGGYLLFLGRMSPDKGAHRAIAVARRAGRPLVLAAKMREPEEHRYFHERVEPLLGPDTVFVGEVGGAAKLALIGGAEALVNPIRWPEPFGLVMIEALACGTPVLAFPEGAAPEIVEDGLTGFLCRDVDQMVERLGQVSALDRQRCRARVESHFSVDRVIDDHLALYQRLLATQGRTDPPPVIPERLALSA